MNNNKKTKIFKMISIYIITLLLSFILGFFITSTVNKYTETFESNFTYIGDDEKDFTNFVNEDFFNKVIENHKGVNLEDINVKSLIKNNDFTITNNSKNNYTIITKTRYYETSFISSKQKIINRAQTFVKYALYDYVVDTSLIEFESADIGVINHSFSPWYGGLFATIGGLIIASISCAFFYKKSNEFKRIEDNETIFHTPFHKKYWSYAIHSLKDVKSIVTLAMLFSLVLISKLFKLPSGFGDLGLGFSFIFLATIAWIYGPVVGLFIGMFSDVLGYFIGSSALSFNPLYTIQAMLAVFVYGLCFYRTKINFSKVLLSRLIINMILNALYGSFLMVLMYFNAGKITSDTFLNAFKVYAIMLSLPKNIVYLLPQTITLFIVFKSIGKLLARFNYIEKDIGENITLF
ncbi:MAG: ECF transporter S component [Bacillales bacterium]|nr:ECF transporter S component [Bacillales bacterium]